MKLPELAKKVGKSGAYVLTLQKKFGLAGSRSTATTSCRSPQSFRFPPMPAYRFKIFTEPHGERRIKTLAVFLWGMKV